MRLLRLPLHLLLGLAVSAGSLIHATAGLAAEKIVFKYGPLQESLAVADLADFAETGNPSSGLAFFIVAAGQKPEEVRKTLTQEVKVDPVIADRVLNSPLGDVVLDKVGESIHTPAKTNDRQAIRSALVLSASNDGKISLLETIQKYPTQEVQVDGEKLLAAYTQLADLERKVRGILGLMDLF